MFLRPGHNLRIGGISFIISAEPAIRSRFASPLYRSFVVSAVLEKKNSTIPIYLKNDIWPEVKRRGKIFDTQDSWTMYRDGRGFWLSLAPVQQDKPLWIARFDRRVNRVTIYCQSLPPVGGKRKIVNLPIEYPLDQLLLMYFLAPRQGMLTHAAGVARGGKAFIFPGASGAGKSTFSGLLAEARIGKLLSDERMIVREIDGAMQAFGTPWAGTAGIARNASAPLAGIFFLKHGQNNNIEKLTAGAALDKFLPLISIPWYDPDAMARIIAFAKQVVAQVPAYELCFKPDRSAVDFFRQFIKKTS